MDKYQVLSADSYALDFGEVYYSDGVVTYSTPIRLTNNADYPITLDPTVHYHTFVEEFPVQIRLNDKAIPISEGSNEVVILPRSTLEVQFQLVPDLDYILKHNVGTALFKVSRRFTLNYQRGIDYDENNLGNIAFIFSADLCTSIMYLEKTSIIIENKVAGEEYIQDIMIWNRSECPLHLKLIPINIPKIQGNVDPIIWFTDQNTNGIISSDTVVIVPSFAPKIITVQLMSKVIAQYPHRSLYILINSFYLDSW
jgi:hypothetical protein